MEIPISLALEAWHWLLLGLILLGVELLVSGAYFLWIGTAAFIVSGVTYLFPLSSNGQVILYAILAITLIGISRKYLPGYHLKSKTTTLNQKSAKLIGLELILDEPIHNGKAQVQLGDSKWIVYGPDLPAGEKVRVIRVDGIILIVDYVKKN